MDGIIDVLIFAGAIIWAVVGALINKKIESKTGKYPNNNRRVRPAAKPVMQDEHDEEGFYGEEFTDFESVNGANTSGEEHFSYETMSNRDFQKEFDKTVEMERMADSEEDATVNDNELDFSEEEIYKGIVYSEILKRKYC